MTDTSTPEPAPPARGSESAPFWADPAASVPAPDGAALPLPREAPEDGMPSGEEQGEPERTGEDAVADDAAVEDEVSPEAGDESGGEQPEDEPGPSRFEVLVEERLRRAHYAHHLTRAVFTPEEAATAVVVERRAAVWVPAMTFVATVVSAIAAVVLATRLRSDPTDPDGNQLLVVTVTVCLLAAAFATLLRAEVHYERLRPVGRVVRHDVADAYEVVRDAPRRLLLSDVPLPVLRRIVGLLPAAEQLVDALAAYAIDGGTRVRQHPAYERILRMRAEVEALEAMLDDADDSALRDATHADATHADATLPKPHQVANFEGLADLAALLSPATVEE